jgi:CheY-like chemotaxis protein
MGGIMKRVLLIDDHDEIRRLIRDFLEPAGYDVLDAESVDAGLELTRDIALDVLITDICMPGKNGLRAMAEFKERDPALRVIAISGGPAAPTKEDGVRTVYHDLLQEAAESGAHCTLLKPFDREELLNAISGTSTETNAAL